MRCFGRQKWLETMIDKKKKDTIIVCMFIALSLLSALSSFYSITVPQCVILVLLSLVTLTCGVIIKKYGTED